MWLTMWRGAALVPILAIFGVALWWATPGEIQVPGTVAAEATDIPGQAVTIAILHASVAATPLATPSASPAMFPTLPTLPGEIGFRGSGHGLTAPVQMKDELVIVAVAYHGDGSLVVWLESAGWEPRQLVDEIGPWDGKVELAIDEPGSYWFVVEADGGPWTIQVEQPQEGRT